MEHWTAKNGSKLNSMGYTLKDKDTIFKEALRLFKKDSLWTLQVIEPGKYEINFKVTSFNHQPLTAENL